MRHEILSVVKCIRILWNAAKSFCGFALFLSEKFTLITISLLKIDNRMWVWLAVCLTHTHFETFVKPKFEPETREKHFSPFLHADVRA